jgi:uncharacterized protein (TIGR00369 family)
VSTEEEQFHQRARFRRLWEAGVPFQRLCGLRVARWDPEQVVLELPFSEQLCAHKGVFHGGVVSALADMAGAGAVMAGHDFNLGTRPFTLALAVHFCAVAPGEDLVAEASCTKRGRANFAAVVIKSRSGMPLAHGLVTVAVTAR